MRYRVVDVFSERPLAGNALCVVLDPCPSEVMQPLSREVNLSETTFPSVRAPGRYDVKIFTPARELPFAGHPTLGTAWCLGPGSWEQSSAGAVVRVDVDASGAVMTQPDPTFEPSEDEGVSTAIGIPGVEGVFVAESAGNRFLLAPTTADLAAARPDHAALARLSGARRLTGVATFRRIDDGHLEARVFVPTAGIPEDPGTGSAAGPIGLLARRVWSTAVDLTIAQGAQIGRPCRMEVHAEEGSLRVGGPVAACAEGRFHL